MKEGYNDRDILGYRGWTGWNTKISIVSEKLFEEKHVSQFKKICLCFIKYILYFGILFRFLGGLNKGIM